MGPRYLQRKDQGHPTATHKELGACDIHSGQDRLEEIAMLLFGATSAFPGSSCLAAGSIRTPLIPSGETEVTQACSVTPQSPVWTLAFP